MDNYTFYWFITAGMAVVGLVLLVIGLISVMKGKHPRAAIFLFMAFSLLFLALVGGGILHECQAGSSACQ